ncbi:hypothetical protein VTO73DRAFT_2799 [Trametes versicolor]
MPSQLPPVNHYLCGTTALCVLQDTGAPQGSDDYTTLVLIHGLGWHSGNFKKLVPCARRSKIRIVLLNRRDYPGARPHSPEELAHLTRLGSSPSTAGAAQETSAVMADHGRDVYDFLVDFIHRQRIPAARGNTGGVVLVGWSLACVWITAFLANVASFPVDDVKVDTYVRRVVLYDPSCVLLGYPRPSDWYHPITDPSIPLTELCARFNEWQAGYYTHGDLVKDGPDALETCTSAKDISSTMSRLSVTDLADSVYGPPMEPSGSDRLLIEACMRHGTWGDLKDAAMYLPGAECEPGADDWRSVDVKVAWCDRSVWEMALGSYLLEKELAEARRACKSPREVSFVRVKGANHFAHWDMPEKVLKAFLGDELIA